MKKKNNLFVFLFLIVLNIQSQNILIGKTENIKAATFDSIQNTIFIFFENHYKKINTLTSGIDSLKLTIEDDFKFVEYETRLINSENYFIHAKGGLVYKLTNDTIKRIDKSFNHLMHVAATTFTYKNKIYRYGGYGFWSARNFITYFDSEISEWMVLTAENSKEFPEQGTFSSFHQLINDEVYFFKGQSVKNENRYEFYNNEQVWKYNFSSKSWKFIGKSKLIDPSFNLINIYNKNYTLLLYDSKIIKIDILNNKLVTYNKEKYTHNTFFNLNLFYTNNRFYFFRKRDSNTYLVNKTENEFLGNKISEESFFVNYDTLIFTIISILTLIIVGLAIRILLRHFKKRNKIVVLENGLRYKTKFSEFDEKSIKIIKTLISEKEISSHRILTIIEETQYSPAHNERLKVQKLEEINIRIKDLLGINYEIIHSKKSDLDRRIRMYSIKNDLFY